VSQPSAKTVARGYGPAHKALGKRWAREVAAGVVACARCGRWIAPGEPWDLGHVDGDRSRYAGPEHVRCNRATASRRKRRRVIWAFVGDDGIVAGGTRTSRRW
jgi:hypothetical protein